MNGLTEDEILATKERFLEYAKQNNLEVVDSYFKDEHRNQIDLSHIPLYFLAKAIDKMSLCNSVYFAKGWVNARGCKIEHYVALQYGLEVIYE